MSSVIYNQHIFDEIPAKHSYDKIRSIIKYEIYLLELSFLNSIMKDSYLFKKEILNKAFKKVCESNHIKDTLMLLEVKGELDKELQESFYGNGKSGKFKY